MIVIMLILILILILILVTVTLIVTAKNLTLILVIITITMTMRITLIAIIVTIIAIAIAIIDPTHRTTNTDHIVETSTIMNPVSIAPTVAVETTTDPTDTLIVIVVEKDVDLVADATVDPKTGVEPVTDPIATLIVIVVEKDVDQDLVPDTEIEAGGFKIDTANDAKNPTRNPPTQLTI